jgi:hypothetical protein
MLGFVLVMGLLPVVFLIILSLAFFYGLMKESARLHHS